jgi:hypothetical protein
MKETLDVGKDIIFCRNNGKLTKAKVIKIHIIETEEVSGLEALTDNDEIIELTITKSIEIYKEITFSCIKIGMRIVFIDTENNFLKGKITRISIGEGNKIIGCFAETIEKIEFELSINEDKVYLLFTNKQESLDKSKVKNNLQSKKWYEKWWVWVSIVVLLFLLPGKIKNIQKNFNFNTKTEIKSTKRSIEGVYYGTKSISGLELTARLTIVGDSWTAISQMEDDSPEYQNGVVNGKYLYDESGLIKIGYVTNNYAEINGYPRMRK